MTETGSAAKPLVAVAIVIAAGVAGYFAGAWMTELGGALGGGEQVMARGLTALFIAGPAGAIAGASVAGYFTWRRWRQPTWPVVAVLIFGMVGIAIAMLSAIGFI